MTEPHIVTDGLVGYWHFNHGLEGNKLKNIAPRNDSSLTYYPDMLVYGATYNSDGLYFDGVDDYLRTESEVNNFLNSQTTYTLEVRFNLIEKKISNTITFFDGRGFILYTNNPLYGEGFLVSNPTGNITQGMIAGKINTNETHNITFVFKPNNIATSYLDGVLLASNLVFHSIVAHNFLSLMSLTTTTDFTKAKLISARLYQGELTSSQIAQNLEVGDGVGLPSEDNTPPGVTIHSLSRNVLSRITGVNQASINFSFDKDVVEWRANVFGMSWDTGTLAYSGGSAQANQMLTAVINSNNLLQEGMNRINIYGKDSNGNWTPYDEGNSVMVVKNKGA